MTRRLRSVKAWPIKPLSPELPLFWRLKWMVILKLSNGKLSVCQFLAALRSNQTRNCYQSFNVKLNLRYKNGKELVPDDKRIRATVSSGGKICLVIGQCTVDDEASYKLEVSNDLGTADSEASLTMRGKN